MTGSPRQPHHRVLIFVVVSIGLFLSAADQTSVATILGTISTDMDVPLALAAWVMAGYSLGLVIALPVAGRLSEEYGRKRVFLGSIAVFAVCACACIFVSNIYLLILLRMLQALGGAGFTPAATGIVAENFGDRRDRAIGLFGSIFPIGTMFGPVISGLLVTYWPWRIVFMFSAGVSTALLLLAWWIVPRDRPDAPSEDRSIDWKGGGLLSIGIIGLAGFLTIIGQLSDASEWLIAVPALVIGVIFLWIFMRRIQVVPKPFLLPKLIYGQGFGAVNLINVIYGGVVSGMLALVPLYGIAKFGMSLFAAGTLLLGEGITVIIVGSAAAMLLRRTGYQRPMIVGYLTTATGFLLLSLPPMWLSPYSWVICCGVIIGAGIGGADPAARNACMQLAPHHAASLAAQRTMGRQLGTMVAVSVASMVIGTGIEGSSLHNFVFFGTGIALLLALPIIRRVPNFYGAW